MSILDDLKGIEQRLTDRMRELQPALEEYAQLEEAARRLGIDVDRPTTATAKAAPGGRRELATAAPAPSRRTPRTTTRRRRAAGSRPRVQRRDQVLALVREKPGTSVPEIARELGVDPTGLYRVVRKLEQEGALMKEGTSLRPAVSRPTCRLTPRRRGARATASTALDAFHPSPRVGHPAARGKSARRNAAPMTSMQSPAASMTPKLFAKPWCMPSYRRNSTGTPSRSSRRAYASPSSRRTSYSAVTTSAGGSPTSVVADNGHASGSEPSLSPRYCCQNQSIASDRTAAPTSGSRRDTPSKLRAIIGYSSTCSAGTGLP